MLFFTGLCYSSVFTLPSPFPWLGNLVFCTAPLNPTVVGNRSDFSMHRYTGANLGTTALEPQHMAPARITPDLGVTTSLLLSVPKLTRLKPVWARVLFCNHVLHCTADSHSCFMYSPCCFPFKMYLSSKTNLLGDTSSLPTRCPQCCLSWILHYPRFLFYVSGVATASLYSEMAPR